MFWSIKLPFRLVIFPLVAILWAAISDDSDDWLELVKKDWRDIWRRK